jgi:phosphotransferase system enzyme I (PtsI)
MSKRVLVGAGVGSGLALGPAFVFGTATTKAMDIVEPGQRLTLVQVRERLNQIADSFEADAQAGSTKVAFEILYTFAAILRDPELDERVKGQLAEGADPSRAVGNALKTFSRSLTEAGGPFAERAQDLTELGDRVIRELEGRADESLFPNEPFVLVADSLSPLDAAKLDSKLVKAVILSGDSTTSHSAIIVRALNLPTVVGVAGTGLISNGAELLVDATSGQVFVEPSESELKRYRRASLPDAPDSDWVEIDAELPVKLFANLGSSYEGGAALRAGAQGVGLFRTELLYLGRSLPPTYEEQAYEYSRMLARFQGKRVIARALDLDDDKPLPFLEPAGSGRYINRGLQVLLANREVLVTQLEALAAANRYYPKTELWVMAPMVLNADEAAEFVQLARDAGHTKVGVMIEVPEITEPNVLEKVLGFVDFVSIGTNDLTNYVLGTDRSTGGASLADVRRPEVLSVIKRVVELAKAQGKPASVCGEAGSDPHLAKLFIELGIDSLSASPALLPQLRVALASAQMFG